MIIAREYKSYQEYLEHQKSKLRNHFEEVVNINEKYRSIVYHRYKEYDLKARTVLCLGARLGAEVESFKLLGAVAIGIDIEPGSNNKHVLYGDFHEINFPDKSFDYVFTNCIDHVYDIGKFLSEIKRVLKKDGIALLEVAIQEAGEYETIDTTNIEELLVHITNTFTIKKETEIDNGWKGILLILTE